MKLNLNRSLKLLSTLIFLLIVVGGLVRNLGAGLSCPDWPLCQGRLIPVFDIRVFAEYFHRLFAASVSLLTFVLAFVIFRSPDFRKQVGRYMGLALILLASQVILGGLTVLKLLKSEIVTLHLAAGTLFFAAVLMMTLKTKKEPRQDAKNLQVSPQLKSLALLGSIACLVLYAQIILGGVVSSHYAGLACPDFPKCLGSWWPGFSGIQGIHFIHRLGATVVTLIVLVYTFRIFSSQTFNIVSTRLRWLARGIVVLLAVQVTLGISNVVFQLPVAVSVAHLAVAEGLFALILMSSYEIRRLKLH